MKHPKCVVGYYYCSTWCVCSNAEYSAKKSLELQLHSPKNRGKKNDEQQSITYQCNVRSERIESRACVCAMFMFHVGFELCYGFMH